jgi:hypothetical protein
MQVEDHELIPFWAAPEGDDDTVILLLVVAGRKMRGPAARHSKVG